MHHRFTSADEGKPVITPDGDVLGEIARIRNGRAYVRPRPNLITGYGSWLAHCWTSHDAFRLADDAVAEVRPDAVLVASKKGSPDSELFTGP